MNYSALNLFMSEENIKRHLEYLRTQKLKLSILEKSNEEIKGKGLEEIYRMKMDKELKREIINLLWHIHSHEQFFESFNSSPKTPKWLKEINISKEGLLYDVLTVAKSTECGYLYIWRDNGYKPDIYVLKEFDRILIKKTPKLCIDLYEHTYYSDYGFKKEAFIKNALSYLDIGKL